MAICQAKAAEFDIEKSRTGEIGVSSAGELDEVDYPVIYAEPPMVTTKVLEENTDCVELLQKKLPERL